MALRPQRIRAAPHRLEDEQTDSLIEALSLLSFRREFRQAVRESRRANESDEDNDDVPDHHHTEYHDDDHNDDDDDDDDEVKGDDDDSKAAEKERLMRLKEEKEGWSTQHTPVQPHAFIPPDSSTTQPPSSCRTALDHFHLIIPPSFIQHISDQINLFAQ